MRCPATPYCRLQLARVTSRDAGELIDEATAELEAAITEVRDLARGVHPPILAEAGLAAALETLAERSPVPVRIGPSDARFQATSRRGTRSTSCATTRPAWAIS